MNTSNDYYRGSKFFINFAVVSIIAIIFSSFTLWIIDSWIKYPFFVTEIFVIIVIYLVSRNYDHFIHLDLSFLNSVAKSFDKHLKNRNFWAGASLIAFSTVLLILNTLDLKSDIIQLVLAFICISFLSGYCILKIFNLSRYFSKLETIILSFIASFVFSGFSSLFLIYVEEQTRSGILSSLFIVTGTLLIIKELNGKRRGGGEEEKREKKIPDDNQAFRPSSFSKKIDILAIIICILFYCFFFYLMYPNATLLLGVDVSRHYSYSQILSTSPDLYTHFNYLLFHSYSAALDVLSGADQRIANIQTIPVILNLLLPISIYALAKRFLSNIDKRIPALSTIFYTFFSNLSFIYFTQLRLLGNDSIDIGIFLETAEKSFNGTINFLQPFFYVTPLSVSFVMLIVAFMLLRIDNIPKIKLVTIFSILILSLNLVHVSSGLIFIMFIIVYSFLSKQNELNVNNALIGSLLGSIITILFNLYQLFIWPDQLRNPQLNMASMIIFILPVIITACLIYRLKILPKLSPRLAFLANYFVQYKNHFFNKRIFIRSIFAALIFIYLFGLVIWIVTDDFKASMVVGTGFIPWFIYPVILGVVGLLAILSLRYLPHILINTKSAIALVLLIITTVFLLGKVISFINVNVISTGYWEIRLIMVVFLFASLLAPIPLIKLIDNLSLRRRKLLTNIFISTTISIIVLLGLTSLVLQTELWYRSAINAKNISETEWEAIDYLKDILQKDTHAFTIAPSSISADLLVFAAPVYNFIKPDLITLSKYPDIPLLSLSAYHLDHAYLYLHSRDMAILNQTPQSWLTSHLLPTLPVVYSNDEVIIYNATSVSFPVSSSNTTLVSPTDSLNNDRGWSWYVNDMLSQSLSGNTNYTKMLDKDPQIFKSKNLVLSFDPYSSLNRSFYHDFISENQYGDGDNDKWTVVLGKWNFTVEGLQGQTNDSTISGLNNIILSPSIHKNLSTISTLFRINDIDMDTSSYASIIHSFQDPNNYQQTGINIYKNNIYIIFSEVNDGILSHEPAWPGQLTDLEWNSDGNLFNMTLSIQGKYQDIFINETKYYSHSVDSSIKNGKLGLSYGRIEDITFYNFESTDNDKLNLREFKDYIPYVESGGNLYVFNTNGYGSIANSISNISSLNSISVEDKSVQQYNNPFEIFGGSIILDNVNNLTSIDESVQQYNNPFEIFGGNVSDVLQDITSDNKSLNNDTRILDIALPSLNSNLSIPIIENHIGNGTITYIDIYPSLLELLRNNISSTDLSYFLNNVSKILPLEQLDSNPINFKDLSFFSEMNGSGDIKINTTSIIFLNDHIGTLWIKQKEDGNDNNDNQIHKFVNVTELDISNYTSTMINATDSQIILNNGRGLYSNISFNGDNASNNILFLGDAALQGISNNKMFKLENVSSIAIEEPSINLYARQPYVNVVGDTILKNYYFGKFINSDQDRIVNGTISFNTYMSDFYTLIYNVTMAGDIYKIPPTPQYNEFNFLNVFITSPILWYILLLLY